MSTNITDENTGTEAPPSISAERERVQAIMKRTAKLPHVQARAVAEGWDMERLELEALRSERDAAELELLRLRRPQAPAIYGGGEVAADRDVFAAGFLLLAGRSELAEKTIGANAAQRAHDMRCRTIRDLFAESLRMRRMDVPRSDSELIRATFSNTDLSNALGLAGDKLALESYRSAPATWRLFANVVAVQNFREHKQIRVNHLGQFETVANGGELKHGYLTEATYNIKADTAGKIFGITRHDIVNDDLGFFMRTAEALGRMAANSLSNDAWRILLANAGSFFGTGNKNYLVGVDSGLSVTALTNAITLLRKQVDSNGMPIDLTPKSLIVPPELEPTARSILQSQTLARNVATDDKLPEGNPVPELTLGVESRISNAKFTGQSAKKWFLFSSPADGCVTVAFLNGQQTPTIEAVDPPPDVLGVMYRGFLDYGVALGDPVGGVLSKGEA